MYTLIIVFGMFFKGTTAMTQVSGDFTTMALCEKAQESVMMQIKNYDGMHVVSQGCYKK